MAIPRVFVSSTFFDLRHVREDLDRFIKEMGYEPVRNETGAIPYAKQRTLEKSAYREVELCDIIVCIIGGRYGTDSRDQPGASITQRELKTALERGIQVFIYVEKGVSSEYSTYLLNKDNAKMQYHHANDRRIYEFLEEVYALPKNNAVSTFEGSKEIVDHLRRQWAGLFQQFLQDQQRLAEVEVLEEMKTVAATLNELVTFLTDERKNNDQAIQSILLANHPAFRSFQTATSTSYRIFFSTRKELNAWLTAKGFHPIAPNELDDDSVAEWNDRKGYLKLTTKIFDSKGKLIPFTEQEWNKDWVQYIENRAPVSNEEDDIPF
jgi:hypothetical protein